MTVICTKPTTEESRKRHAETFGEKPDRYCETCGRLPAWCECSDYVFLGGDRDTRATPDPNVIAMFDDDKRGEMAP